MTTPRYNRSDILNYFELSEEQKVQIRSYYHDEEEAASEDSYVLLNKEALPLSMFMKIDNSIWHGVYGSSAFSAYFIKISRCGTAAVVAERFS